jgi:hypothetical protein
MLRRFILFSLLALLVQQTYSQSALRDVPRMFVSTGFVTPRFYGGTELLRAADLRQDGASYFKNSEGDRRPVGSYANNTGFSLSIGYYLPLKKVPGLSLGALVNSGQTGSNPATAGYEEGYFFNFVNVGFGLQYYPLAQADLYLKGELGMGSVFTKNRFLNAAGEQDFLHHFGIGMEGGLGVGYTFTPFPNKTIGLFFEGTYQYYRTRVEVSGIGDDNWRFGAWHLSGGLYF